MIEKVIMEGVLAIGDIIVGVDISFSRISVAMGKINNFNQVELIAVSNKKCKAYDKFGLNEVEVIPALTEVIEKVEEKSNLKIYSAHLTIPSKEAKILQRQVSKQIDIQQNNTITKEDVISLIIDVAEKEKSETDTLIELIPDKFMLDDGTIVEDPIGLKTTSLTILSQVITAKKSYIQKLQNIFKKINIEIDTFIPIPLINKSFFLEPQEKNDNVLIVDVGAKTTEIGLFLGGTYIYQNTFDFGGDHITNDLAYVFQISKEEADSLKHTYGIALKSYIENDNTILLSTVPENRQTPNKIKISNLVEIIEGRIEDMFNQINQDLKNKGIKNFIDLIVLCGQGVNKIEKSDLLAKVVLNIPVKYSTSKLIDIIYPEYHTVYGMIKYLSLKKYARTVSSNIGEKQENTKIKRIIEKIKDFFYS